MPWKESDAVSERMEFIVRLKQGERMVDLCREFGIEPKTGYKLKKRFDEEGPEGLFDKSRRPHRNPRQTAAAVSELIVKARRRYPTWGPKKLRVLLQEENPRVRIPAASTIGVILDDAGLIAERPRRRRTRPTGKPLRQSKKPNDIWTIDFKGQFRLGNQRYCYPLTVADHFSRFLLACDALESTKSDPAQCALQLLFKEYGLPEWMRSDNGTPFASCGLGGLSKLAVWLMRIGVHLERIEPGQPQQNGRHERMHKDVKAEATKPAGANLLQQQELFDVFRARFNEVRPHEALDMKRPADIYVPSQRQFVEDAAPLKYPLHDHVVRVYTRGEIFLPFGSRPRVHVGEAFIDQELGLRRIAEGTWLVSFMDLDLGYLDEENRKVVSIPNTGDGDPMPHQERDGPLGGEPSPQIPPPDLKNDLGTGEDASRV